MQLLSNFIDALTPAIEIRGFRYEATYRCEKCSNKKRAEIRHPVANFTVLDRAAWDASLGGVPFVYVLVAVCGRSRAEAARYVGIGKSDCLMRRWTRLPEPEKHRHDDGSLIHHMPATLPRLQRDFQDPAFVDRLAHFRLYASTLPRLILRLSDTDRLSLGLPTVAPPNQDTCYALAEQLEDRVIQHMRGLSLSPWNGTRGVTSSSSAAVFARGLTLRSKLAPRSSSEA